MSEFEHLGGIEHQVAEGFGGISNALEEFAAEEMPPPPPLSGELRRPPRPSSRALAIAVVLATLLAATLGYLLNRATTGASNAGGEAQEAGLLSSSTSTADYTQAENDYQIYLSQNALQAKAADELLEAHREQPNTVNWADQLAATQAQVSATGAEVPSDLHPLLSNGDPDPNFPYDFFARRDAAATALQAQSEIENTVGDKWNALVDAYTVMVTMVAVALFLFGSAFGLYGPNRMLFTLIAVVLIVVSTVWAGFATGLGEPGSGTSSSCGAAGNVVVSPAACDYAQGMVAAAQEVVATDAQPAIDDFTAAINAQPDFAQAYEQRADAETFRGEQTIGSAFVSNIDPYWLQLDTNDEKQAYDLGLRDSDLVGDLAFDEYQVWLTPQTSQCTQCAGASGSPPSQSLQLGQQAVQLDPTPPWYMNLGIFNLATGNYQAATQAYQTAAANILYSNVAQKTPQPSSNSGLQQSWLAGGMTDLENLATSAAAANNATLRNQITADEGVLIGSYAQGSVVTQVAAPALRFSASQFSFVLDPNDIDVFLPVPNGVDLSSLSQPMTFIWYERPDSNSHWSAIAETTQTGSAKSFLNDQNQIQSGTAYLDDANQCLPPVQYRVEVYLGGALAGGASIAPGGSGYTVDNDLRAAIDQDLNIGMCIPGGTGAWHMQKPDTTTVSVNGSSQTLQGSLSGTELHYASSDGSSGVYIFRAYLPHNLYTGGDDGLMELGAAVALEVAGPDGFLVPQSLPSDLMNTPSTAVQPFQAQTCSALSAADATLTNAGFTRQDCYWAGLQDSVEGDFVSNSNNLEALISAGILADTSSAIPADSASQDQAIAGNVLDDYAVFVEIVYGPAGSQMWSGADPVGYQVQDSSFSVGT